MRDFPTGTAFQAMLTPFRNKLLLLVWCCLLSSPLLGQQRIECVIHPSFDAPAVIQLQPVSKDTLLVIFRQTGRRSGASPYFSWADDTTKLVHVRKMGRYFQQFAFADTIRLANQGIPFVAKSYQKLLTQVKALAAAKDDRLLLDGLTCQLAIFTGSSTPYRLTYRTPAEKDNQLIDQFIKSLLMALKMKSTNPATVNYCMIADGYMQ